MGKFCANCGTQLADNAKFCMSCGNPIAIQSSEEPVISKPVAPQQTSTPVYTQPSVPEQNPNPVYAHPVAYTKQSGNKNIIWGIIVVVLALALIVGIIFLTVKLIRDNNKDSDDKKGGKSSSYSDVLDYETDGIQNNDWDTYKKAYTKEMQEYYEDLFGGGDEYVDFLYNSLTDQYGEDFELSYKISDSTEMDEEEIKELEEDYKDQYDIKITIDEAYTLSIKMTVEGEDDSDTEVSDVTVVKIDGDWYNLTDLY